MNRFFGQAAGAFIGSMLLIGCTVCDEFSKAAFELEAKLDVYVKTANPTPVIDWVSHYHGEAPSHQMMIRFVDWGDQHRVEMNRLLELWPLKNKDQVLTRLQWAGQDSGQVITFHLNH